MNYAKPKPEVHLTRKDLSGIGACMRKIFTVAEDNDFDGLLARMDRAASPIRGNAGRSSR